MLMGPNDYEYQILSNQIAIMSAVSLFMSESCANKPELTPIAEKISELMKENGERTRDLLS
jgi:hypothetical protein